MTGEATALLSVRGEAQSEVAPDEAMLVWAFSALEDDKAGALRVLAHRLDAATGALRDLGGVVRSVAEHRRALAWLVGSAHSEPEQRWHDKESRWLRTGRVRASAALTVLVRDFNLLSRVGAALAGQQDAHLRHVNWLVDHDNRGWQQVRGAAVDAAVAKARDYAAALGGTLVRTEHVADIGLLGDRGGDTLHGARYEASALRASAAPPDSDGEEGPALDPVPQELEAGIEARFTATVAPLS